MPYADPEVAKARARSRYWKDPEKERAYRRSIYDPERARLQRERRREQCRLNQKAWRERKLQEDPLYRSTEARKSKYGISREQLEKLLSKTQRCCQVCGNKFDEKKREPCVDHCHETGVIRGLLCQRCNVAEGALKTPENARKLYEYMLRNELFYLGKDSGLS